MSLRLLAAGLSILTASVLANGVRAAEIKVVSANVFTGVIDQIAAEFTRTSGHKAILNYYTVGQVRTRILADEPADVTILTQPLLAALMQQNKVTSDSVVSIARSGVGMAVRAGGTKPDISTVDSFKRTLLAAKSIAHPDPARGGASGILLMKVFDRLGIVEEMKRKTKFPPPGQFTPALIVSGEAELGMTQPMEFLAEPGVLFVGWLPAELQSPADFSFAAAIPRTAKEVEAARVFIHFLTSPPAAAVFKAKGMEPG